jgi:thioredoxin 1
MPTVELNKDNFESTVTGNSMVLVDFWAPWCGPCRSFAPVYEQIAEKYPDIVFGKVNTEEERELAGAFGIRSIPTLMIFREQIILFEQPGAMPGSMLDDLIGKVSAVDMAQVKRDIAAQEQTQTQTTQA